MVAMTFYIMNLIMGQHISQWGGPRTIIEKRSRMGVYYRGRHNPHSLCCVLYLPLVFCSFDGLWLGNDRF